MSGQVLSKGFQGRGISAFGEIEHLALGGISDQGQVRMSSLRRGLVNRHRSHFRQVRGVDGQVDILGENGLYPMPGFAHESGHGPPNGICRANIRINASNNKVNPYKWPAPSGSRNTTRPSGNRRHGTRTSR
jgi:hypothetical protein